MGEIALRSVNEMTPEQIELIKATVCKGATDNELKLFLYRAENLGLDPLKPGQIHFVKYGNNPGTVIVGIDGFRGKANRTGKLKGIKRGVLRDEKGKCIGAYCEVFRSDWDQPAREEVPLSEYNTGKGNWSRMPETMIKKVAEVAALRMAFPDELGGVYAQEEMDQAENQVREIQARQVTEKIQHADGIPSFEEFDIETSLVEEVEDAPNPADYVLRIGKDLKGKKLGQVQITRLKALSKWYDEQIAAGKKLHPDVDGDLAEVKAFLSFMASVEKA